MGTTFSKSVLNSFVPIMVKHSQILVRCLESYSTEESVDLASFTQKASLDTILGEYDIFKLIESLKSYWDCFVGTAMGVEPDCKNKINDYQPYLMAAVNEYVLIILSSMRKLFYVGLKNLFKFYCY